MIPGPLRPEAVEELRQALVGKREASLEERYAVAASVRDHVNKVVSKRLGEPIAPLLLPEMVSNQIMLLIEREVGPYAAPLINQWQREFIEHFERERKTPPTTTTETSDL